MISNSILFVILWVIIQCLQQLHCFRSTGLQTLGRHQNADLILSYRKKRNRDDYDDDYDPFQETENEDKVKKDKLRPKAKLRFLTAKPIAPSSPTSTPETQQTGIEPKPHFYSRKALKEIGLNDRMVNVVQSMGIVKPSKVQALAFSTIYSGKSCIIGDQTGSGKTLAYLLPILQRMDELFAARKLQRPGERAPYVIIMTPTTELADQVATVAKTLGNALKFRTSCFTSLSDFDGEQKKLRLGTEVLVTTPGRLFELMRKNEILLNYLQVLILDEVDVLFLDKSFPLQPIGQACPDTTQFLFTSATLPSEVTKQILTEFPNTITLYGPGLHRISPNIHEIVIDCSGDSNQLRSSSTVLENKREALIQALDNDLSERTLIFCNTIEQCRKVENFLLREDRHSKLRDIYIYHRAIDSKKREDNLYQFSKPLLKRPSILICTDRTSRGLDFNRAYVDHVILFDFPFEPSEYLRRVGRTGRAGRPGKATVLVYGKQVDAAKMVVQASIEGKQIDPSIIDPKDEEDEEEEYIRQELTRRKKELPYKPEWAKGKSRKIDRSSRK